MSKAKKRVSVISSVIDEVLSKLQERGKTYDKSSPAAKANFAKAEERNMGGTVAAFNAITGKDLTEAEGWMFMQLLKMRRQATSATFHRDSMEDQVAYSLLEAECRHMQDTQAQAEKLQSGAQVSLGLEPHRREASYTAAAKD